jgi:hypothetical protein
VSTMTALPAAAGAGPRPAMTDGETGSTAAADRMFAHLVEAAGRPHGRPHTWPDCAPPAEPVLAWLRRLAHPNLYHAWFEAALATRFGPDLFGLGVLPPAPDFLAGFDFAALRPEHVAPFLRRISLTEPAPDRTRLTAAALGAAAADAGRVSTHHRTDAQRAWDRPAAGAVNAPTLPETTRIPHLVHAIWLGGPIPAASKFLRNCAAAADTFRGEVDVCLWTDLPRVANGRFPQGSAQLAAWARENGVLLVNMFEVFHADNPMLLRVPFALEMCKQLPRGYAGASDHLRVEVVNLFGGAYVDGDIRLDRARGGGPLEQTLPELIDAVAAGPSGFTVSTPPSGGIGNDMIIAPARHPALRLWMELARLNYYRTQPQIFGGLDRMAKPYVGRPRKALRYEAPSRSGRIHHTLLRRLGLTRETLVDTSKASGYGSESTWVPARRGEVVYERAWTAEQTNATLEGIATFLAWQLHAREGNLYLSAVSPVLAGFPDSGAALTAVLRFLVSRRGEIPEVTSITELRWNDDCRPDYVDLPAEAEAMIDRAAEPEHWLGRDLARERRIWLLDELVTPVALGAARSGAVPRRPPPARVDVLLDPAGAPAGLRLRSGDPRSVSDPVLDRAAYPLVVPPGYVGLHLEGRFGEAWLDGRRVRPEQIAALLKDAFPGSRPCLLAMSWAAQNGPYSFAARLAALLGVPVHAPVGRVRIGRGGAPLVLTATIDETCRADWGAVAFLRFTPDGAVSPSPLRSLFRGGAATESSPAPRCAAG